MTTDNAAAAAPRAKAHDHCCAHDATPAQLAPLGKAWTRFRVATMDCANEEAEIRRAVDGIAGIRALTFQLGQRTLAMDAPGASVALAVAAIRKAGFDPQPIVEAAPGSTQAADEQGHEHAHGFESGGLWRLGLALLFAIGAELVGFFAPETQL